MSRLVIANNVVFRPSAQTKTELLGYEIFTEKFVCASKAACSEISDFVFNLLKSDTERIKIALALTNNSVQKSSDLLGVSLSTASRLNREIKQETDKVKETLNN